MKMLTALTAVSVLALSTGWAHAAEQNFKRDRNVSVAERPRPDYDATGIPAGAFTVLPKATLSVTSDDNIYVDETGEESDVIFRARLEAQARSNWSRHRLEFHGFTQFNRYADNDSENADNWGLGLSGQLDLNRADTIGGGADYSRLTEARTDPTSPLPPAVKPTEPVRFNRTNVYVSGLKEFNRLRLLARADYTKLDFRNDPNPTVPLQDYRDREVTTQVIRAEYAVSPATALYVEAAFNQRDYRIRSPIPFPPPLPAPQTFDRSSDGTEVSVGANFELSSLTRGEIQIGHVSQDYEYAAFPTIKATTVHGKIEWFPTQLLTFTVTGDRSVQDASSFTQAGYLATVFTGRADYELLRNLILNGQIGHETDDFKGTVARKDKVWSAGVGATWLVNRNVGVRFSLDHLDRDSTLAGADYEINRATLALVLQR